MREKDDWGKGKARDHIKSCIRLYQEGPHGSKEVAQFMRDCLLPADPSKRPALTGILGHKWLKGTDPDTQFIAYPAKLQVGRQTVCFLMLHSYM